MPRAVNLDNVLSSPHWFPSGFDVLTQSVTFHRTSLKVLRAAPFHDGRTNFQDSPEAFIVSLEDALRWTDSHANSDQAISIIAHTSFVGSTLLARMFDIPERVMSYREPQILVHLANLKRVNHPLIRKNAVWTGLLRLVLMQLQTDWNSAKRVIIKPSNWANNILEDIVLAHPWARIVCLTSTLETYLVANQRGGDDRIKVSLDMLNHFLPSFRDGPALVETIEGLNLTPIQKALHLLALCFELQLRLLRRAEDAAVDGVVWMDKDKLTNHPGESSAKAAEHFGLELSDAQLQSAIERTLPFNAKIEGARRFHADAEWKANSALRKSFAEDIATTLQWHRTLFEQPERADKIG